jgi:hypothetical protein
MRPNARATEALEEDTKLTRADMNNSKTKHGWTAATVLVPSQALHSSYPTSARARWTMDEDTKLTGAVQLHGSKNWNTIAALVPGRTRRQCYKRWRDALNAGIVQAPGRASKWTADEDTKLKDAVETHNGKNWEAITRLVPGRTRVQCLNRWHYVSDTRMDRTSGQTGEWTPDEDAKLKDAVHLHDGKNWHAIAALVHGRTRIQCCSRWHVNLDPRVDRTPGRTGEWNTDEDTQLKDAVRTHDGKDWNAIASLVPGRAKEQCYKRWRYILASRDDRTPGRTGRWSEDEDNKLKDAVQTLGSKDWDTIAALVPSRTKKQCHDRWHYILNAGVVQAPGRRVNWTADEDTKLKDAVQVHDGKNWDAIARLVPGRTKKKCLDRWRHVLDPSIDRTTGRKGH